MASPRGSLAPRRAQAVLLVTALLGLAACGGESSTPVQSEPPLPPEDLGGPLTLTITAPDSSITERLLSPSLTYAYVCTLSLLAGLSGGEQGNAIVWQDSQIEWHWLSDGRFRHRATWPREQLAVFWGSDRLTTGQRRQSLTWQFTGSMPYRLSFDFQYLVEGEDSVRVQESEVRCVGPSA